MFKFNSAQEKAPLPEKEQPKYPPEIESVLNMSFDEVLKEYSLQIEDSNKEGYVSPEVQKFLQDIYKKDQELIRHAKDLPLTKNRELVRPTLVLRHSLEMMNHVEDLYESDVLKDAEMSEDLFVEGAQLHDYRKKYIANQTLNFPGRLTPQELEEVKGHSRSLPLETDFEKYLKNKEGLEIITTFHHPLTVENDLEGEKKFKVMGIILSIIDIYESMTSEFRAYNPKTASKEDTFGAIEAIFEITQKKYSEWFDSEDEELCKNVINHLKKHYDENFEKNN